MSVDLRAGIRANIAASSFVAAIGIMVRMQDHLRLT
jgi:hypothetical protein